MKHIGTWLKRKDPGFSLLFAIILAYFQVILFIQVILLWCHFQQINAKMVILSKSPLSSSSWIFNKLYWIKIFYMDLKKQVGKSLTALNILI